MDIGTTERVVQARTVHRLPAGQQRDGRYAKSVKGVPWPNPAETAEGEPVSMARIVNVPMVPIEHRPVVPVVEPREFKARRFYGRREEKAVMSATQCCRAPIQNHTAKHAGSVSGRP